MKLFLAILFILSAIVSVSAGVPKAEIAGEEKIDLGKFPANAKREVIYRIKNAGDEKLKIINVRHTCGCAETKLPKSEIGTGETGEIQITIKPYSLSGSFSKYFFVETNDPNHRFIRYIMAGNAAPILDVSPENMFYAGRIKIHETYKQIFQLVPSSKDVELGEPKVECNYPVDVNLSGNDGKFDLAFSFTPEKAAGDLKCGIFVPIKKPEGWKPAEIRISAAVGIEFLAVPSSIFLSPLSETAQTRKFNLRFLGGSQSGVNPEDIKWEKIEGVDIKLNRINETTIQVNAEFSGDFVKKLSEKSPLPLVFTVPGNVSATVSCGIE